MDKLILHIESLIFTTEQPISKEEIIACLEACFETDINEIEVEEALLTLQEKYGSEDFSFELNEINGGFVFLTKGAYHNVIGQYLKINTRKMLSKAALETLAIIAYKQPVTKSEVESIRGVGCDYTIQKLLDKELVAITGRSEGPGRPLLYCTSERFMDYFGLNDLNDLPKLKDFQQPDSEIGSSTEIVEEAIRNTSQN
ncbi:MAG: SMC-Scp complex subunit ScpB [Saprospiraceae bacterium]|nr:SMC-Scp complex subunit ScpB [Saprospiraceae bacterium]